MRPEHDARRKIIREWMSLPRDKRATVVQATAFAKKVIENHKFPVAVIVSNGSWLGSYLASIIS
jgi:hypothetical protein